LTGNRPQSATFYISTVLLPTKQKCRLPLDCVVKEKMG